ncbi:MAG: 2Fe-2S iron-sulfur cluster binding domain-containing protein [Rhodocyclaceae bacterium]|nr:MAG: 2Fe-2S iron-sulfur cluster binding domain-containing protein [Rhodocyclaceae bacterium]
MPEIIFTSGMRFYADSGTSILDAAVKAQVAFPYSCRTGRCSTCKCKVVQGETVALQAELGLSSVELADGWILGCVRAASSDLLLEVEDLGGVTLPPPRTLPCRIASLDKLAPDVLKVMLRLPPTIDFRFMAGQYIDVIGRGGVRRSYSLARAMTSDRLLELHIRAVEGGCMSHYWFAQAQVNDLLRLHGPLGTFFLREPRDLDVIFLATGTGLAPVKAMLESLADAPADARPRSVKVLWGGRVPSDLYLELQAITGVHDAIAVLSRADSDWGGARGYVQDVLLGLQPDLAHAAVYACGSDAMIRSARDALVQAGLPRQRFYSDAFVCSANHFSS